MDLLEITATSLACLTGFMSFINVRDKKRKKKQNPKRKLNLKNQIFRHPK